MIKNPSVMSLSERRLAMIGDSAIFRPMSIFSFKSARTGNMELPSVRRSFCSALN
jgi:hypothetical protein